MVFTKKTLLQDALKLFPSTTPKQPNFKKAIEAAYFAGFETQKENLSPESYLKLENEFLKPFCKKCRDFYLEKKVHGNLMRIIEFHTKFFDMNVPRIDMFIVQPPPPPPEPMEVAPAPAELPNPYGDRTVKRPLKKTQRFEVNMVAKCMYLLEILGSSVQRIDYLFVPQILQSRLILLLS